jgi:hypothetical protein
MDPYVIYKLNNLSLRYVSPDDGFMKKPKHIAKLYFNPK